MPTFSWTLLISSWCRCGLHWFKAENCRLAGLELACISPPFHGLADQWVHEVHSDAPGQKISISAANGSFNPCARPFGHIFCICLYIQCIGVHWRVPNGLVARNDVFGKGVGPAGLQPLHNTSPELVICITFGSRLRIGYQMSNSIISMSS